MSRGTEDGIVKEFGLSGGICLSCAKKHFGLELEEQRDPSEQA